MKKIEALIRTSKLERVTNALLAAGVAGMTVTEVHGHGHQTGPTVAYRGAQATLGFVLRVKVETIVADCDAEDAIDAIYENGHTGEVGDGLIVVTDLESVVRIRTGELERDAEALIAGVRR